MPDDTLNKHQDELNPSERIIWSGQPQQGLILRPADALLKPFSLLWGGFAIFWTTNVITLDAPLFFMLWGTMFVLIGLYMIVGRFFAEMAQRRKTVYALTNRRAIILSGLFAKNTKLLTLNKLPEINLSMGSNGRGTITFGPSHPVAWMYSGSGFPNRG